jgi:uncharacterized membrane protein
MFIAYQVYRLSYDLTLGLDLLTVFDAFIVWLTWLCVRPLFCRHAPR